jgi:N-acetylmuramoyl-L-alanine amidase
MKKLYNNPGHSDRDPGAVGYETERRLNVKVSQYMKDYLLANYECETKMNPGTVGSLTEICNEANAWGADLFVSNHFNAGGGDGYEALVYNQQRVELGKIFAKHVEAAGQNLRLYGAAPGVKIRRDLTVLSNTAMPSVANEGAFVDNLKDIQDWNEDAELKALGIAYAKAAAEFLELEEKKEEYTQEQFVRDVQAACGAAVDGKPGPETISKTPTLSAKKNSSHPAVEPVQKRLFALGYTEVGEADGVAGAKFTSAVAHFQQDTGCFVDGEAAEWGKTWHKLLEMA